MKTRLQAHPIADLWGDITQAQIDTMAESISRNGQLVPIKQTPDGQVIDGRTRWLACEKLGIEPRVEVVEDMDPETLLDFANSLNEIRRDNATTGQKAARAAMFATRYGNANGGDRKGKTRVANATLIDRDEIGGKFGVNKADISRARQLLENAPDLFKQVQSGVALREVYDEYRRRVKVEEERQQKVEMVESVPDIAKKWHADAITFEQAVTLAKEAKAEEIRRQEEEERARQQGNREIQEFALIAKRVVAFGDFDKWFDAYDPSVNHCGGKPLPTDELVSLFATLKKMMP